MAWLSSPKPPTRDVENSPIGRLYKSKAERAKLTKLVSVAYGRGEKKSGKP